METYRQNTHKEPQNSTLLSLVAEAKQIKEQQRLQKERIKQELLFQEEQEKLREIQEQQKNAVKYRKAAQEWVKESFIALLKEKLVSSFIYIVDVINHKNLNQKEELRGYKFSTPEITNKSFFSKDVFRIPVSFLKEEIDKIEGLICQKCDTGDTYFYVCFEQGYLDDLSK